MRKILARLLAIPGIAALAVFGCTAFSSAHADTVPVQAGDTLSGIASAHGVSLSALEAANPQISNPNLIYTTGPGVNLPGTVPGNVIATPGDESSAPQSQPGTQGVSNAGGISIPGMPPGLADCIWFRESTRGTNPAAAGNQFGIIPASGYNVAGDSLAQQEQVAGQIYAQSGGGAWSADGCPGT